MSTQRLSAWHIWHPRKSALGFSKFEVEEDEEEEEDEDPRFGVRNQEFPLSGPEFPRILPGEAMKICALSLFEGTGIHSSRRNHVNPI